MFDAYTARKAAPRIVLAVIGINLSIYLCLAAVDITNLIGRGLADLITGPFLTADSYDFGVKSNVSNAAGLIGGAGIFVAAGGLGAVAGGIATFAAAPLATLGMLLILMIPIALVALAVMVTIVIRQALLIFLIIASPVAIAAFVLPGTEKYFRSWLELFTKTLLVYPIIAVIFAMSDVFGSIIFRSAEEGSGPSGLVKIITGVIVIYAPLVLIPFAFRFAGGAMGRLAAVATSGAKKVADVGPIKGRREIAKRDYRNREIQARADFAGRLQNSASRNRRGLHGRAANRALKGLSGAIGGYNIEEQSSAVRAQMSKVLNDQINTGRDEEIRGLTVNKKRADRLFDQGDTSLKRIENGKVQYKSLGGAWIDEAQVDAGQKRWGRDTYAQQAALSYEMRKAATDEQVQDISKRYADLATGDGGWGMSDQQAAGAFIGAGFENQNTHLEFKHTGFDFAAARAGAANGGASLNYAKFAEEAYEKKGTYALSQMSGNTIQRLTEAHQMAVLNGDVDTQRKVELVAENFMTRYGGGGGNVVAMEGDRPLTGGAGPGAQQGAQSYQTSAPGAAAVAERVRRFAADVGVYQDLTNSPTPPVRDPGNPPPIPPLR